VEFGKGAREPRRRYHEAAASDPALGMHAFAVMGGPDMAPPETFTEAHRMRVLGR
jgi:hypothetical protein